MGILLMNIGNFALPEGAFFNPHAVAVAGPADMAIWLAEFVLVDGKMRNIFTMLFGAGILLLRDRAVASGMDDGRLHTRRLAVLGLFGLAHFYLLWTGDILFQYAVIGTPMLFFADRRPAFLLGLALLCLTAHFLLSLSVLHGIAAMRSDPAAWRAMVTMLGSVDPSAIAADIRQMQGSYAVTLHHRIVADGHMPFVTLFVTGLETAGMMLLGMALFRTGFLQGRWSRGHYAVVALTGYGIGLPVMLTLAARTSANDFDPVVAFGAATVWSLPARPLVALAHVAVAIVWAGDGNGPVRRRIAAAGRAAFTNYLGTTLVMTTLFYGYGGGLYGRLDRLALLGIVVCGWAVMLLWSAPWLSRHNHGPLEWLWRRLARPPAVTGS
ncbi:MAG TPA: DUF418 domain-containing protein [Sphingomonas sp.]|jgi:uncharacterized protein|uniref:DUF418 domain-containing protein n=1 Tax=Sphingomonas sp. TaxID=28214 RepID=UPI002EDB3F77